MLEYIGHLNEEIMCKNGLKSKTLRKIILIEGFQADRDTRIILVTVD